MAIGSVAIKQPGDLFGSPDENPLIFTFNLVRLSVTYFLLFLFIWTYSMVAITVAAFSMTSFIIFLLRLGYNQKKLIAWRKAIHFSWAPLYPYLAYNTTTLLYLFIVNDPLSRVFVAFLGANMPVSAVFFIILVTRKKENQGSNSGVLIQGLLGCVPIQLAAAQLTKRLHSAGKGAAHSQCRHWPSNGQSTGAHQASPCYCQVAYSEKVWLHLRAIRSHHYELIWQVYASLL